MEHVPRTGGDDVPVHEDVELGPLGSLGDLDLEPGSFPDDGGETRRLGSVASEIAVENLDLHGRSFALPVTGPLPDRRFAPSRPRPAGSRS